MPLEQIELRECSWSRLSRGSIEGRLILGSRVQRVQIEQNKIKMTPVWEELVVTSQRGMSN